MAYVDPRVGDCKEVMVASCSCIVSTEAVFSDLRNPDVPNKHELSPSDGDNNSTFKTR